MQITSEPLCSDPCARLKIQIPMHSISWGCPKKCRRCDPISLLTNTFGIHLEPRWKSHEQIINYCTVKNVKKTSNEFLWIDPEGISCIVWPVVKWLTDRNVLERKGRKQWALRPQKPLRLNRDGEVGGSGIFIFHTYSLHCHHQNDSALRWAVVWAIFMFH